MQTQNETIHFTFFIIKIRSFVVAAISALDKYLRGTTRPSGDIPIRTLKVTITLHRRNFKKFMRIAMRCSSGDTMARSSSRIRCDHHARTGLAARTGFDRRIITSWGQRNWQACACLRCGIEPHAHPKRTDGITEMQAIWARRRYDGQLSWIAAPCRLCFP